MVPEKADRHTFWEHIYRYRFAKKYCVNKSVLDIACGEGYGSAGLKRSGAREVTGVDISEQACLHAKNKYEISAIVGDAETIPLKSSSVEVIVSFETIEHVPNPSKFLDECKRVLTPNGRLIISTPNREAYRKLTPNSPFHCSEMSFQEFSGMCLERFHSVEFFFQRPIDCGLLNLRGFAEISSSGRPSVKEYVGRGIRKILGRLTVAGTQKWAADPVRTIAEEKWPIPQIIDPYVIFSSKETQGNHALFSIAVAERKKH